MPHIAPDASVVAAPERQISTTLAGEVVILDVDRGVYFGLAEVSEILDRIISEYEVRRDVAEADLHALLADLAERGLIEIDDSPGV